MATVKTTTEKARAGVGIVTQEVTTIQVAPASIEILIGGPYTSNGEEHTYGHVAVRVLVRDEERVYDFGRYNGETGPYGQGRLRIWAKFSKYIAGENATGRVTTGFMYRSSATAIDRVRARYNSLIEGRPVLKAYGDFMKEYRLAEDYHALKNNCATTSLGGARTALNDIDFNPEKYNQGRGMSMTERTAARIAGWPKEIFMPADLQVMLQENTKHPADKIERYGGRK
jgi:hypothetical protein